MVSFETLEQARAVISGYIDGYHHRPFPGWPTARRARSRRPGRITTTSEPPAA